MAKKGALVDYCKHKKSKRLTFITMKKWQNILLHSAFWFYIFIWGNIMSRVFSTGGVHSLSYYFKPLPISHYVLFPAIFYFNYFFILPKYYKKGKIAQSWIGWILLFFAFTGLRYLVQEVLFLKWFGISNYFKGTTFWFYIYDNLYYGGLYIVMSILLWIIDDNLATQKEKYILLEEKNTAQLAFLKNQVNPHFIFNTLNNIYALVSARSDKALPSIEKLSQLMRYMYKDSEADKVSLQSEKDYIDSFIDLQTIRLANKESIKYTFEGNTNQLTMAPLLLIPFIENMFKHGIINQVNKPLEIHISVAQNKLSLFTSNYINTLNKDESSGIGLKNVEKRLALLYPKNHTLSINNDHGMYTCHLHINLN